MTTSVRMISIAILALLTPAAAWPQTAAAPPPAQEKPAGSTFTAGWRDGFFIQNETGDFRLQIGVFAQADGRFVFDDTSETFNDTFSIRRLRTYVRGRIAQRFEFFVNPDFAGGTLTVFDAYLDTRFSNAFRVRVGKGKVPFGHERAQSASAQLFFERAFPSAIAPNRDLGVQVLGDVNGGVFSYQAAVLNGTADGGSADVDNSDSKDVAGRLVVRPFVKNAESPLAGLTVALSATAGNQSGTQPLPAIRTSLAQQTFLTYTGSTADGTRTRYSPFASYYRKRFGGFFEYARSEMPLREGSIAADIAQQAWQIAGSYLLTGDAASEAGVRPKANSNFGAGQWGAFQIAARYHAFSVDEAAIRLGLATAGSSREANAWTVGLNWYWNPYIRYTFNLERTVFDDNADDARSPENIFAFRTQLYF
jgi:phosphate-selective porin OprO/OprP